MLIELHILQNFAPSNLNRDDTGSPKDCEFGGYRRARISSQCLKRAMRTAMKEHGLLPEANRAERTKRLVEELAKRLATYGRPESEARAVAEIALNGVGLKVKDDGKTEYLLFLGENEIAAVAALCEQHWDELAAIVSTTVGAEEKGAAKTAKNAKKAGKDAIPPEVGTALKKILNGGKAADLALFGRMLADLPDNNIDAASQVAHALSTNKVSMEFDFYTAVDDLKPDDTAGADMLGTVEFNSACFYRYMNIDVQQLVTNLGGDRDLAKRALTATLCAAIEAVPTGKQNSTAAQNPPSLVLAVARRSGLWSLANAFVRPVRPEGNEDLVQRSVKALDSYWGKLTRMYGDSSIVGAWVCDLDGTELANLNGSHVETVGGIIENAVRAGFEQAQDGAV